jgi:hypothetical protein
MVRLSFEQLLLEDEFLAEWTKSGSLRAVFPQFFGHKETG